MRVSDNPGKVQGTIGYKFFPEKLMNGHLWSLDPRIAQIRDTLPTLASLRAGLSVVAVVIENRYGVSVRFSASLFHAANRVRKIKAY
jgi:hypothetical protein